MADVTKLLSGLEQYIDNRESTDEASRKRAEEGLQLAAENMGKTDDEIDFENLPKLRAPNHESYDKCLHEGEPVTIEQVRDIEEFTDPAPFDEIPYHEFTDEQERVYVEWEKRSADRRHKVFIHEMIAHGNRRVAYLAAYPGVKKRTAYSNAYRLLCDPGIAEAVRRGVLEKQQQAREALKKAYDGRLADIEEKRTVLAQIIRGETLIEREVLKDGKHAIMYEKAQVKEMLRAIMIDNKMEEEWLKAVMLTDDDRKAA
jgi:hypothetical protein